MSITDELREWAKMFDGAWFNGEGIITFSTFRPTAEDVSIREIVESIADRIDEQHRKALEKVAAMVDEPDEIERRVKALEHLTEGMLLDESELRERVEKVERKLEAR